MISCVVGIDNPMRVIVPPGVVHGYINISNVDGYVLNFPNKLYAGKRKKEPVDEIRHENSEFKEFVID
jgi:dTDP-4-dehydrorhamnose 3,5-epimerase